MKQRVIYTIERRSEFGGGTMESHYEVRQYERRTPIGVLIGGKMLKKAKKKQEAEQYCARRGFSVDAEEKWRSGHGE